MFERLHQVRPRGNPHVACLDHVCRAFVQSGGLSFETSAGDETIEPGAVVIGAHLMRGAGFRGCAIWNTEQVSDGSPWLNRQYINLLADNEVWDYSQINVMAWRRYGIQAKWVPLGYSLSMVSGLFIERCGRQAVFYGSSHPRREEVVRAAGARRLGICYGEELDAQLAVASVVLNIHYYPAAIFELVRCSYLFANAVPVLSEECPGDTVWPGILPDGTFAPYDELAERCRGGDYPSGAAQSAAYQKMNMGAVLECVNR